MTATIYAANKIIDDLLGLAPYSWPPLWLSLHTADPTEAGLHTFEVTGGGYARLALTGIMSAASSRISINTSIITIGPATSDWGTITFLGIEDSATIGAGNQVVPAMPSIPRTITAGQPFQIPAGQFQLAQR